MTVPATTEPTTPAPAATDKPQEPAQEPAAKPEIDWKAEARKHEQRAKENAAKAKQFDELLESQKSEAQKLADRAAQAEAERDAAKLEALRVKVGAAKKLPADVVDLLKGDTEEELAAHADRLAEHFKASVRPSGPADQGPRGTAPAATPRDEFAAFVKQQMGQ
jgi:hypothetical protein